MSCDYQLRDYCVATLFIRAFWVESRKIYKSCVEIGTPQLKRWRLGHSAMYTSKHHGFTNHALRTIVQPTFSNCEDNTSRSTYLLDKFCVQTFLNSLLYSSPFLRLHIDRQHSRTLQNLSRFRSMIILTSFKLRNNHPAIHALRISLRTNELESRHYPGNGISFKL